MSSEGHRRLTLASSVIGAMIVALDGTVLTVVQPTLQRDLHASFAQVQWTSTGYLIAVASLLVFAGRLGDRYGHRRIFATGILGFAATSAGIGLAPDIGWVIGLRVAQGIFGALLQPATLGILRAAYPRDRLGMPIALRTSAIGVAAAAGPIVGGALAAHLGWRAVFFLNVAPALAVGLLTLAVRPPAQEKVSGVRLDLPGACLLAVALACLVRTLVEIPETGWTAATALGLVAVAVTGGAFVRHERRATSPLVPSSVLRSATVTSALGILVAASASLFGALFVGTYFLQDVLALDPLQSGLRVLPLAATMVLGAPVCAVLLRRWGPRGTAGAGMALLALGILLLSRLGQAPASLAISGCFLVLGAGFSAVMVTGTAVIVHHASVDTAGVAGGLQQTAMNVGPALGVAAATTLMTLAAPAGRPYGDGPHRTADAFASAMGPTLVVLAAVALIGALSAAGLPGRAAPVLHGHRR
ncbi:MFS transporter [Streptosporangium minutum]|uniref:MFS transporter n=1 Tax=Streptosporangium minutum TaxID=569862 RepID=A0A243RTU0_9ACTN|nr:MFS transporter [Streptosporangium minutum]OUC98436.1 MFS transporter [Streptosporangium minutum]